VVRRWTPVVLAAALLARLPAETLHVSFQPGGTQTHTEVGPARRR
jgi:hypothetical protein